MNTLGQKVGLGLIKAYKLVGSPWVGGHCKHLPTCSDYAAMAIERFGLLQGSWLAAQRLGRCGPNSKGGWDPVPQTLNNTTKPRKKRSEYAKSKSTR